MLRQSQHSGWVAKQPILTPSVISLFASQKLSPIFSRGEKENGEGDWKLEAGSLVLPRKLTWFT